MFEAELATAATVAKYADIVVAFNVAQTLAFSYRLGQKQDELTQQIIHGAPTILRLLMVAGSVYLAFVIGCTWQEVSLRSAAGQSRAILAAICWVGAGRGMIIAALTAVAYFGLKWNNALSGESGGPKKMPAAGGECPEGRDLADARERSAQR
jgi:hypothetical protein